MEEVPLVQKEMIRLDYYKCKQFKLIILLPIS